MRDIYLWKYLHVCTEHAVLSISSYPTAFASRYGHHRPKQNYQGLRQKTFLCFAHCVRHKNLSSWSTFH